MKFHDLELEFDIFDLETAEKYEAALKGVEENNRARPEEESLSKNIRRQCGSVFGFFDALLGEGFHRELFGEKTNLIVCLDVFAEFQAAVTAQKQAIDQRLAKYSHSRAERRAKK